LAVNQNVLVSVAFNACACGRLLDLGEGAGWHSAFLILMLTACPLWQIVSYRRILLNLASAAILVQALLHWLYPLSEEYRYIPGSWTPGTYPSYIAFMVGYVWLAWAVQGALHTPRGRSVLALCALLALYASRNASGMTLLGSAAVLSVLVLALMRFRPVQRMLTPTPALRGAVVLLCLLPLGWYGFSAYFTTLHSYTDNIGPLAMLSDKDGSLGSRIVLNQIGMSAMHHEPARWLIGNGWGGFTDDVFKYVLVDDIHVFEAGERAPNNLMVDSHTFHSHSQPLEALLALGLPGMALWFALPMLLLWSLPTGLFWYCAPMLLGLTVLPFLWFELAQCVPYRALGFAALYIACAQHFQTQPSPHARRYLAGLLCGMLAMGWSAWEQKQAIAYGMELREAAHALPVEDFDSEWIASDLRRGGDRLRSSMTFHAKWLTLKSGIDGLDDNDRGWYTQFMQVAQEAATSPGTTARVALLDTWMKYNLLASYDDPVFAETRLEVISSLADSVMNLARIAPLRDDLASAFLLNLPAITEGDEQRQLTILNQFLAIAPDHRGALWVLGGLLSKMPEREAEGKALRKKAAALGVERVYPVTYDELADYK